MTGSHPPQGVEVIRAALKALPDRPGVYRMLNGHGDALYVGKAKSLRTRVRSYTREAALSYRIRYMVAQTVRLEVTTTTTEAEALLLEANLIKRLKPRYNILLRDDKSFPYILMTGDHPYPRIMKHRGARKSRGEYFGPFASAGAVNETIATLQRAFLLRPCSDTVFEGRSRPCLQYQIKRCSAPCVGYIDETAYAELTAQARDFLSGKSRDIQQLLTRRMEAASAAMDYEKAAEYRDRIAALTRIQSEQRIHIPGIGDTDVFALYRVGDACCIQAFFFRGGQNFGNRAYFPSVAKEDEDCTILGAFIGQFYQNRPPPKQILLSTVVESPELIEEALALHAPHKVALTVPQRGEKRKAVEIAYSNARAALERRMQENRHERMLLEGVFKLFGLEGTPVRIEVYDNSHIMGTHPVGAMIVAGPEGFRKNEYRRFTIRDAMAPGDDYGMMREVLRRRGLKLQQEDPDRDRGLWPDLLLIDGGAGQLSAARAVLEELGMTDLSLVAISKGPDRHAGREQFHIPGRAPFTLPPGDPVLHYLQRLRDEAHRFAIGSHRKKREKALSSSPLDDIPGIGTKRKRALLHHFGSARAVSDASVAELSAVEGINATVAEAIYSHFHGS